MSAGHRSLRSLGRRGVVPWLVALLGASALAASVWPPVALAQAGAVPPAVVPAPEPASPAPGAKPPTSGRDDKPKRKEIEKQVAALPERYRAWLEMVELLISEEELGAFLRIEKDYQRDAFIARFWLVRDPYPSSPRNELRARWEERIEHARALFDREDERTRYFLLNGPPGARIEFTCSSVLPLEVWYYRYSDKISYEFFLIFVRRFGRAEFTLWRPTDGIDELLNLVSAESTGNAQSALSGIQVCRDGDIVVRAIAQATRDPFDYDLMVSKMESPAQSPAPEWVATFQAYSTDLVAGAALLPAEVAIAFPSRIQSRTVVETSIQVSKADSGSSDLAETSSYNFFLTGEILEDGELFENFRYRFDFPADSVAEATIPLLFQRRLRPGKYRMVLKIEDLNSDRVFREERDLEVPYIERQIADLPDDPESRKALQEAAKAIGSDVPTLTLIEPFGQMQAGLVRFEANTTGSGIAEVRFALDGRVVMQKRAPPFSVELDLGRVPRTHVIKASAHDAGGREIASDQLTLNAGRNEFEVRFVEPTSGSVAVGPTNVRLDVQVPEGSVVERVELSLDETPVATLYQEPFAHQISIPAGGRLAYLEAVAYLPDGNSTREHVFLNAPENLENVEIQVVEMYAVALDRNRRPVVDLEETDFSVLEDGVSQEIRRFERVENLPLQVEVMIDISASMVDDLDATRQAALRFFESAIEPRDRAALFTFNDHPYLAVDFTNDLKSLAGGLAGLKAERGTALWDSLVFGLYYLNGVKGQRAVLLLSDGQDESSRFEFEDALEYARRSGVAIYAIGLDLSGKGSKEAKAKLEKLGTESGGGSFFIATVDELPAVYEQVLTELRSRYLISYQSTNSGSAEDFRAIELRTSVPGVEARTMSGYYP